MEVPSNSSDKVAEKKSSDENQEEEKDSRKDDKKSLQYVFVPLEKIIFCKQEDCGLGFITEKDFKRHEKIHEKKRRVPCKVCDKRVYKDSMKKHMKIHNEEKEHICDDCNKGFNEAGQLKIHMRIHTGEKPYACPECGINFAHRANMKRHLKTHKGDKPYSPKGSGKSTNQQPNVEPPPTKTPTVDKPYPSEVSVSERGFVQQQPSVEHQMRTPTPEKPYFCHICGNRFGLSSSLYDHLRSEHFMWGNAQGNGNSYSTPGFGQMAGNFHNYFSAWQ